MQYTIYFTKIMNKLKKILIDWEDIPKENKKIDSFFKIESLKIKTKTMIKNTIDLRAIIENEKNENLIKRWYRKRSYISMPVMQVITITCILITIITLAYHNARTAEASEINFNIEKEQKLTLQDKIRLSRLRTCQEEYKNAEIGKKYIHEQIPAVRCATYMTLVYSFESNFWQSRMCKEEKNCMGMTGNWIDTPAWFLTFETYQEWERYFAQKYWKWHYKKKINTFINDWSTTHQQEYKQFLNSKYDDTYRELEKLFLQN